GFSVEAIYAFGENDDQADAIGERDNGTRWGIGAGYKNGPVKVGAAYHNTNNDSDFGDNDDTKEWMLGGGYNFGFMDLNLAYVQVKNIDGFDGDDEKTWYLNGAIPVSESGKILLGYAQAKYEIDGIDDQKIKAYTLAYTHGISKRTTAYAGYTHIDNDDLGAFTPIGALRGEVGEKSKGFAVGVRHTF